MTPDVVCFGELLLRLAAPGYERLLQSPHLQVFFGGAEANVAGALAAFGHSSAMVSAVPDNPLGAASTATLRSLGVDARHVLTKPGRMGLYFHTQGAMQRASEVVYDRANSSFALLEPDALDWDACLRDSKWFHVSGITPAVSRQGADSTLRAMQAAQRLGIRVSFDCNYRARVWAKRADEAPAILKALCMHANLLFADDRDFALILGHGATAAKAFEQFPKAQWIARTQRAVHTVERQSYAGELLVRGGRFTSRAHDLSGIVERIGGGDAFAAGLLHGLLIDEHDLQSAVEFATAAAAYKHSLPGDVCIASVSEIESHLGNGSADIKR